MFSLRSTCLPALAALLFSGCASTGGVEQPCKVFDPDLAQGVYSGGCKDGLADGYGEVVGPSTYRGEFRAGKKDGRGIKVMPNGDRYEGEFKADYRDGKGVYVWGDKTPWAGNRYEGEYRHDLRHGWGVFQWNSGDRYEGEWQDDLRMGLSVMELRRAQAAEAAARVIKVGAMMCAEEKWDSVNVQRIRGVIEGAAGKMVKVRVTEIEGGVATYSGKSLTAGDVFTDAAAHWRACGPD